MEKYKATSISIVVAVLSFVCTWTFIVPLVIIMPAAILFEGMFKGIYGDVAFDIIGRSVIAALLCLFIATTSIYYFILRNQLTKNKKLNATGFIGYLITELFILHPLFFYIHTSENWSAAGDGQFVFGIIETFPICSMNFIFLGVITDLYKNYKLRRMTL